MGQLLGSKCLVLCTDGKSRWRFAKLSVRLIAQVLDPGNANREKSHHAKRAQVEPFAMPALKHSTCISPASCEAPRSWSEPRGLSADAV